MINFIIILVFVSLSCLLIYLLLKNDHGEKEPKSALIMAAIFGLGGLIGAFILESLFIPKSLLVNNNSLLSLFGGTTLVAIIEETLKFVPLAFYIYKKRYFNEHTDGIIYFVIAGLSFGLPENILYTISYGSSAGLVRLILTPLFHAALTGMVGYFLIKTKLDKKNPLIMIWFFILAIFLHDFYDFGLLSKKIILVLISILITLSLSIVLFILYLKAQDLDKEEGLSVVGINKFCRNCGAPNPEEHLYCTNCGKRA